MLILNLKESYIECWLKNEKEKNDELNYYLCENSGVDGFVYNSENFIKSLQKILDFYKVKIQEVLIILNGKIVKNTTIIKQYLFDRIFENSDFDLLENILKKECNENEIFLIKHDLLALNIDNVKIENPLGMFIKNLEFISNVVFIDNIYKINFEKTFNLFGIKNIYFESGIEYEFREKYNLKNNELMINLNLNSIDVFCLFNDKIFLLNSYDFGMNNFIKKIEEKFNLNNEESKEIFNNNFSFFLESEHLQKTFEIKGEKIYSSFLIRMLKNEINKVLEILKNIIKKCNFVQQIFLISDILNLGSLNEFLKTNIVIKILKKNEQKNKQIIDKIYNNFINKKNLKKDSNFIQQIFEKILKIFI